MTNREKEILEIVKKEPLISQQDIADLLGITRSSVAVHIANLMKKGYIRGKGYVIGNQNYVTVLGGSNIDIQGFPTNKLRMEDSNPGKVRMSLGGVGRNIAENLVKLDIETKLITALGNDLYGHKIKEECKKIGIDLDHSIILENKPTSIYLSLLDEERDMKAAISDMDIIKELDIKFLMDKSLIIKNSNVVVVDTNIDRSTIQPLVTSFKDTIFFLDTVSVSKAKRVKDFIGFFHTIKPNKFEAEAISNIEINSEKDVQKNIDYFLNEGVKRVFITAGRNGVYYGDAKERGHVKTPLVKVVNTTGAGDAFAAGLVYSFLNDLSIKESASFATGASLLALSHENTINPNMSLENIKRIRKELNL